MRRTSLRSLLLGAALLAPALSACDRSFPVLAAAPAYGAPSGLTRADGSPLAADAAVVEGDEVRITGKGLAGIAQVRVGGLAVEPSAVSEGEVRFVIPSPTQNAASVVIRVEAGGEERTVGQLRSYRALQFDPNPDLAVVKPVKAPGQLILRGRGFSPVRDENVVRIGDRELIGRVLVAADDQLIVDLPADVPEGNVVIGAEVRPRGSAGIADPRLSGKLPQLIVWKALPAFYVAPQRVFAGEQITFQALVGDATPDEQIEEAITSDDPSVLATLVGNRDGTTGTSGAGNNGSDTINGSISGTTGTAPSGTSGGIGTVGTGGTGGGQIGSTAGASTGGDSSSLGGSGGSGTGSSPPNTYGLLYGQGTTTGSPTDGGSPPPPDEGGQPALVVPRQMKLVVGGLPQSQPLVFGSDTFGRLALAWDVPNNLARGPQAVAIDNPAGSSPPALMVVLDGHLRAPRLTCRSIGTSPIDRLIPETLSDGQEVGDLWAIDHAAGPRSIGAIGLAPGGAVTGTLRATTGEAEDGIEYAFQVLGGVGGTLFLERRATPKDSPSAAKRSVALWQPGRQVRLAEGQEFPAAAFGSPVGLLLPNAQRPAGMLFLDKGGVPGTTTWVELFARGIQARHDLLDVPLPWATDHCRLVSVATGPRQASLLAHCSPGGRRDDYELLGSTDYLSTNTGVRGASVLTTHWKLTEELPDRVGQRLTPVGLLRWTTDLAEFVPPPDSRAEGASWSTTAQRILSADASPDGRQLLLVAQSKRSGSPSLLVLGRSADEGWVDRGSFPLPADLIQAEVAYDTSGSRAVVRGSSSLSTQLCEVGG